MSFGDDKIDTCKPNQTYSFDSGTFDNGEPWLSVFAGDQSSGQMLATDETFMLSDPVANGQPKFSQLAYTDVFPYNVNNLQQMPACNPNDAENPLDGVKNPDNTAATSCYLEYDISIVHQTFTATIFTDLDGFRAGLG